MTTQKRLLAEGIDPGQQKRGVRLASAIQKANTFEAISSELLEKKRREGRADATLEKVAWLFGLARPDLGPRPVSEITAPEILSTLRKVEVRGNLESARRPRSTIGEVFRYAIATGRALDDPTTALKGALISPNVRHRAAIIDPDGFGALLRAIDGYQGQPEVRACLQLLALIFTRPSELRLARWQEFDLEAGLWIVPATRMKMHRPHRVPLAQQTVALLMNLRNISGNRDLLFPGTRTAARPISENTLNAALRRMGFTKDEMTGHGFRASASSILNESGQWNPDAIEAQLAHVEGNAVSRAYARGEFWNERVRMMAWWADRLDDMRKDRYRPGVSPRKIIAESR